MIRFIAKIMLFALVSAMLPAASYGQATGKETRQKDTATRSATPPAPENQTAAQAQAKSVGCLSCHSKTDSLNMHSGPVPILGCTDCHGGDATVIHKTPESMDANMARAHVLPLFPKSWGYPKSNNPERTYTLLNKESPEFIRFINPSDLRVAREACGACHKSIIEASERSLMSTTAMLWGGAAYNNGILPYKRYVIGEAYTRDGKPATVVNPVKPDEKMAAKGILPSLIPMPSWETLPPGDVFRVFERGGRNIVTQFPEIGLPNALGRLQQLEEPGRPDIRQSNRGPGTGLRIAVPVINIHKTRLNDPTLWFLGTNDQPGDYRSSGCAACHVVYANDRTPKHSGPYAKYGHEGKSATIDPMISKKTSGHPIKHSFTKAIPTSQCMICHMHQPNVFVNSFLGYTMWDYESDAPFMWPKKQKYPTDAEAHAVLSRNPEEAAIRGNWSDLEFLKRVSELNPDLKNTQFADYHGHGWNFRAIFKKDRKGNLLDKKGEIIPPDAEDKWSRTVHMSSIHADKGMHCVDCHFGQDAHGNGHIYGEVASAIEVGCKDCHGTADHYPSLRTTGPAAPSVGTDLSLGRTADGRKRFEWLPPDCNREPTPAANCRLMQRSQLTPGLEWEVSLVRKSVNPAFKNATDSNGEKIYNEKAARAKFMSKQTKDLMWGFDLAKDSRAHGDDKMECFTCHLSWTTSCAGCHLPIQANWKTTRHHYEGGETRNYATYNPQVARDQMFQLGRHGDTKKNTIAPVRSSSALILSSKNTNREWIYIGQPPVAASGFSSQAFAPHFPHTVRKTETKTCVDCHLSRANDNNAIMAQLLLLGTNFVNFVGPFAWVGGDGGVEAVKVAEYEEPQAVIGSYLHKHAYPDWHKAHRDRKRELPESYKHPGNRTGCVQIRGEYLYAAEGPAGMRIYDVASIANKGISQRIISAPFSPLGHDTHIASKNATCVVLPTNQPINPLRNTGKLMRETNREQPFHPIYNYAFITDAEEGLIVTNVNTMQDGEPRNNFLSRALTWNEGGVLTGARHLTIAGTNFYVSTPRGIVVLNMDDPMKPWVVSQIKLPDARSTAVQFRYLFAISKAGLQVVDITNPVMPKLLTAAQIPLDDAKRVYVARTYAYIAAGKDGLAIVDVEKPHAPKLVEKFNANGAINDAHDVIVASTNASLFAYVADGKNGLKVVQLTSPDSQPRYYGFSPKPVPQLVAWRRTAWPALSLSKGLDRDRAVDETGNQIAVFGRLGSRPFTQKEMQKLYQNPQGVPWFVDDDRPSAKLFPKVRAGGKGKDQEARAVPGSQ